MQSSKMINWYNGFSKIYDLMSDYPYQEVRKEAINTLNLQEGDTVIDLFCGTGVNFKSLAEKVGSTGKIIAIDGSSGMLSQAQKRITKLNLNENQFTLYQQDLLALEANFFEAIIAADTIPKVIMILGVAGHPDWNPFWDRLFQGLPVGTNFTTMDVSCVGRLSAKIIGFLGAGKFSSEIADYQAWKQLKSRASDYTEKAYHPFNLLRCSVIVASGEKSS
jgi:SAM-dependent methyltransferase